MGLGHTSEERHGVDTPYHQHRSLSDTIGMAMSRRSAQVLHLCPLHLFSLEAFPPSTYLCACVQCAFVILSSLTRDYGQANGPRGPVDGDEQDTFAGVMQHKTCPGQDQAADVHDCDAHMALSMCKHPSQSVVCAQALPARSQADSGCGLELGMPHASGGGMQVGGRGSIALATRQAEAPPQAQQAPDCDHLGFLVEGGEDDASVHALVQVASENLELKQRLHDMSTELLSLQTIVHRCHLHQEMEQEHQQVEKHKFEWKSRYWNAVEHERFLQAVKMHGHRNFKAIAAYVGSRTPTQVARPVMSRNHAVTTPSPPLLASCPPPLLPPALSS